MRSGGAFTSQIIIDHVKSRDNVSIDNVKQALDRAVENGVKTLVIQPTHLMDGLEYHELVDEVAQYSDAFEHLAIGKPLLTSEADFRRWNRTLPRPQRNTTMAKPPSALWDMAQRQRPMRSMKPCRIS